MTIKQTFSAILSIAFMTATGLVVGTPVTSEELRAIIKKYELSVKQHGQNELEKIRELNKKMSRSKFHAFMKQIHFNDYR